MPRITIDGRPVDVAPGRTVLDAAHELGIDIPTLCHLEGCSPNTTCMVCVVRIDGRPALAPSCATVAREGMVVESETPAIRAARRTAMELLLSDHCGDCLAPCQRVCPAHMDIPRMLRQIADGRFDLALSTAKEEIALPATLGRICPAPCEKGCRRAEHEDAVSVCVLKRFVADEDLARQMTYLPPRQPATGKRIAIVGSGPAGLAAAYHLLLAGHQCVIIDRAAQPGGAMRTGVDPQRLPHEVLDGEIRIIAALGAVFRMNTTLGAEVTLTDLAAQFDAVLLAMGELPPGGAHALGLALAGKGLEVDKHTWRTAMPNVFAAGAVVRPSRMAIRSLAEGKAAAGCIDQFLRGIEVASHRRDWTVTMGRLDPQEWQQFRDGASNDVRCEAPKGDGLDAATAMREAARCLGCDCSAVSTCRLRHYASLYEADGSRFPGTQRPIERHLQPGGVDYEPAKCIACGLCVQIAQREGETLGLAFVGRGFNVRVAVPFDKSMTEALRHTAQRCVDACPTGAISFHRGPAALCHLPVRS